MNKLKKKNRVSALVVLLLMGLAVTAAILAPQYFTIGSAARPVKTNLPLIRTSVAADDGREYTVSALFTVELDAETRRSVNNDTLHAELTDIVQGMDMQALAAANGIEYVNEVATAELNKRLSDITNTETNVYVYDLYVGDRVMFTGPDDQRGEFYDAMSSRNRR
jgi:hypothetical protein